MAPPPEPVKPPYAAGILAWLVPGAGHWYLGLRARGAVIFIVIGSLFWTGIAIGGLRSTVDANRNRHWFLGQICAGGHALVALTFSRSIDWGTGDKGEPWGKKKDLGVVYAGVAGMLNLLAVFDAIVRSISGQVCEVDVREDDLEPVDADGRPPTV